MHRASVAFGETPCTLRFNRFDVANREVESGHGDSRCRGSGQNARPGVITHPTVAGERAAAIVPESLIEALQGTVNV